MYSSIQFENFLNVVFNQAWSGVETSLHPPVSKQPGSFERQLNSVVLQHMVSPTGISKNRAVRIGLSCWFWTWNASHASFDWWEMLECCRRKRAVIDRHYCADAIVGSGFDYRIISRPHAWLFLLIFFQCSRNIAVYFLKDQQATFSLAFNAMLH